jgi:hypothetical protein
MNSTLIGVIVKAAEHTNEGPGKVIRLVVFCPDTEKLATVMVQYQPVEANLADNIAMKLFNANIKKTNVKVSGTLFCMDGKIITRAESIIEQNSRKVIYLVPTTKKTSAGQNQSGGDTVIRPITEK